MQLEHLQIERLTKMREDRNDDDVFSCMDALTTCAETGEGNLLDLAVKAARARASLGEISYAYRKSLWTT